MTNRCVDIVVGLAAGSEGKGKVISMIAEKYAALVRTGGPNAAHTVIYKGKPVSFHILPCGSLHAPHAKLVMGAGAQLDIDLIKHEIEILKSYNCWLDSDGKPRLYIDPQATIIETIDKVAENGGRMPDCGDLWFHPRDCDIHNSQLGGTCAGCSKLPKDSAWSAIGSTTHGTGANYIRKAARGTKMAVLPGMPFRLFDYIQSKLGFEKDYEPTIDEITQRVMEVIPNGAITDWGEFVTTTPVALARDNEFLKPFLAPVAIMLNEMVDRGEEIMLEGTQGALLSVHHSHYPKCTSRDTNASNWAADAGISPLCVRDVYGVTRTFPIRVAGDSGPLSGTEIKWSEVSEHATGKPVVEWMKRLEDLTDFEEKKIIKNKLKEWAGSGEGEIKELANNLLSAPYMEEITTATKRKRRVFNFGEADFKKAVCINRPTNLSLTFVDYLNLEDFGKSSWDSLSQRTRDWITTLESKLGVFFKVLSTGPNPEHTIIRKSFGEMAVQLQMGRMGKDEN